METSSTILAVASPPGRSARGIIRISGADAFSLLRLHLHLEDAGRAAQRRGPHFGSLALSALPPFRVMTLVFPAPHSYTGEDTVELQLPGNPVFLQRVIDALIESGTSRGLAVRRAEPGEFTARAFFNGRLSLTQAEGVAATIAAQSDAELRAARLLTSNRLGDVAHELVNRLANALALVEAGIDFTDQEDVVAIAPGDLRQRLCELRDQIRIQLDRSVGSEQLQAIPWVVLVGEPNAGKSALFNALLGHERAVVSAVAGTTRDVLTEPLTIDTDHGRAEVMLIDLAGIDQADLSTMNQSMQKVARQTIDRADLILRCMPVDEPAYSSALPNELIVRTKCDLASLTPGPEVTNGKTRIELQVSAHTRQGLNTLCGEITRRLSTRAVSLAADALALQPRHEAALRSARAHLEKSIALVEPTCEQHALVHPELIAAEMRAALDDLANLAGDITPDDILGRVFATFCVGK